MSATLGVLAELILATVAVLRLAALVRYRTIVAITAVSFGLRVMVGLGMFVISAMHWPILASQQYRGGFWAIAPDAVLYHRDANALLAFMHGGPLPAHVLSFSWVLAGIYAIFGVSPALGAVLDAAIASTCIPLAFVLARWTGSTERTATFAAAAVAFWPSSFAWSSFILKDALQWLALLMILAGAVGLLAASESGVATSRARLVGLACLVFVGSVVSAWLRGPLVTPVVAVVVLAATLLSVIVHATWRRPRACLLLFALLLAVGMGNAIIVPSLYLYQPTLDASAQEISSALALRQGQDAYQAVALPSESSQASTLEPTQASSSARSSQREPSISASTRVASPARSPQLSSVNPGGEQPTAPSAGVPCPPAVTLLAVRGAFIQSGGASLVDPNTSFNSCWDLLQYAPRAFELAFLSPLPAQWRESAGSLGKFRALTALDSIALWTLFPGLVAGILLAIFKPQKGAQLIAGFVLLLGYLLPIAAPNYGSFFRLRIMILLPAAVLAIQGWDYLLTHLRRNPNANRHGAAELVKRATSFQGTVSAVRRMASARGSNAHVHSRASQRDADGKELT